MFAKSIIAAGALLSVATAVPFANHQHQKRDIVWVTSTQEDVVTMQMTTTVWLEPGETAPAYSAPSHYGHHSHSVVTSHIQSTVTVAAASSSPVAPVESSPAPPPSSPSTYEAPSSSSVYLAPTTPSTTYVAPTTTSVSTPPPAPTSYSSSAAAPAPSGYSGGGSGLTGMAAPGTSYTGDLTYYAVGMGACGFESTPGQSIVAMSYTIFDAYNTGNPNDNPLCNQTVTIQSPLGGSYQATIVDRCPGCETGSLDLSQGFFTSFGTLAQGRLTGVKWSFD